MLPSNSKKGKGRLGRPRVVRNQQLLMQSGFPPPINAVPIRNAHIRYRSTGTVLIRDIYRRDLLNLCYGVQNTSTFGINLFGAVKLNRVDCWAFLGGGDTSVLDVAIDLTMSSDTGPHKRKVDVGNAMRPAYVSMKPDRFSLANFWSNSVSDLTEVLFTVNSTSALGTVVDIWIEWTQADGVDRFVTLPVAAGNNLFLYNNLDNSTSVGGVFAGSNLVPQGVTTAVAFG